MNWISVKDRLPPEEIKVLALEAGGVYGAELITLIWSREKGWSSTLWPDRKHYIWTYWQPMIETPERFWEHNEK